MSGAKEIFPVGVVVQSIAGRDRKRVFIVVGTEDIRGERRLLLVNGDLHRAESPKSKNVRHVKQVGVLTEEELIQLDDADNLKLREIVGRYDSGLREE